VQTTPRKPNPSEGRDAKQLIHTKPELEIDKELRNENREPRTDNRVTEYRVLSTELLTTGH